MSKNERAGRPAWRALAVVGMFALGSGSGAAELKSLTVCADPGNMPLSNQKGEGFENKIAEVIGRALGSGVQYYWRPSIERGLMRTTLSEGNCDLWMDMASDTEGAIVLAPLYRSTFVLAYRNDRNIHIQTLDDPALKKLRVGVFQVSAIRQSLAAHGVVDNTVIHYLSHNADIVAENQPSFQVQQVIDGRLDVAAAWGPMAGYYRSKLNAPLTILPVNLLEDHVPLEFDMTLAVPRGRPDIKAAVEQALASNKEEIHRILTDFGVPLVECSECTVSGDLKSHGAYTPAPEQAPTPAQTARAKAEKLAALKKWLAQGAKPNDELQNAIIATDIDRVRYLLAHGADVNAPDREGNPPLINAARNNFTEVAGFLVEQGAKVDVTDLSRWTPLMFATWVNNPVMVSMLIAHGARLDATDSKGMTPLAIAAQNGKFKALQALVAGRADVNLPVGKGGYTPLMLACISGSEDIASFLIDKGAKVNAVNPGGVSALMIAAADNRQRIAELLLKSGADRTLRSEDGRTALDIAEANSNETMIKLLQGPAGQADRKPG